MLSEEMLSITKCSDKGETAKPKGKTGNHQSFPGIPRLSGVIFLQTAYAQSVPPGARYGESYGFRPIQGGAVGHAVLERALADGFGILDSELARGGVDDQGNVPVNDPVNNIRPSFIHLENGCGRNPGCVEQFCRAGGGKDLEPEFMEDALNDLFTALPDAVYTRALPPPQPSTIAIKGNPGVARCNTKIITDKGWYIANM